MYNWLWIHQHYISFIFKLLLQVNFIVFIVWDNVVSKSIVKIRMKIYKYDCVVWKFT